MSLAKQTEYYGKLSAFWSSVANKYPNPYNKHKETIFTRELKRVKQEMKKK